MRQLRSLVVAVLLASAPTFAATQRTFVASTGSDANPCSIVLPCRGFAAALLNTAPGGEIIVQDSAGYGPVAVGKSVSIIAPRGVHAGISVASGTGISVNGGNIVVVLRGLSITGQGGSVGISFVQGARLTIEDCEIDRMLNYGIDISAGGSKVSIRNSVVRDGGTGVHIDGPANVAISGMHISNANIGVLANSGSHVTIADSVLANLLQTGIIAWGPAGYTTDVTVTNSTLTEMDDGFDVVNDGGLARLAANGNTVTRVTGAAFTFAFASGNGPPAVIYTTKNNFIGYNNNIVAGGGVLTQIPTQ